MRRHLGNPAGPDNQLPTFFDDYSGPFAEAASRVEVDRDQDAGVWRVRCHKCGVHDCSYCSTPWYPIGTPRPWSHETHAVAFTLERYLEVHHDIIASKISAIVEAVTA
jgi:hypothetical protein